jgi:hypothetical protein
LQVHALPEQFDLYKGHCTCTIALAYTQQTM